MSNSLDYEGVGYWLRWQVPVCAFIIVGPAVVALYILKNVKAEPLYLDHLWKPQWRYLNPLWLLSYRVFAFVCLAPFLYQIGSLEGAFAFYFYTQRFLLSFILLGFALVLPLNPSLCLRWTFTLVMVYFALGIVISAYGCWVSLKKAPPVSGETSVLLQRDLEVSGSCTSITYKEKEIGGAIKLQSHYAEEAAIRQRAGFWGYLMQTIYQTCAGAVILTDIVFWCILLPFLSNSHFGLNVLMGCMHSLNAVFLVLDTVLNSLPFPWFRLAYFVQWSCIYVVFQWVIHACGFTWWPYPFLELNTPWAPLWYFSLAVVHIPCYGIYALIVKAKNSLFPRLFPRTFVRSY